MGTDTPISALSDKSKSLDTSVTELRLVGERRDRCVGAHRADGFLPGRRHRLEQELQIFLRVAEALLAIEQRDVGRGLARLQRREIFEDELRLLQPLRIGVLLGDLRLDLLVGDDAALFEVDQQHLARLQAPLLHDIAFRDRQNAGFDAMMTRSSAVTSQRAGRSPLRSSVPPIWRPSVKAIAAGPSHGSIRAAWYS